MDNKEDRQMPKDFLKEIASEDYVDEFTSNALMMDHIVVGNNFFTFASMWKFKEG